MGAFFCMRVVMNPAKTIVEVMSADNGHYRRNKEQKMEVMPYLFREQEENTDAENRQGQKPVMVFPETMAQGISANQKGQRNHTVFEKGVCDNIKTKNRKAGQQQRKYGAMHSTGYRSRDA